MTVVESGLSHVRLDQICLSRIGQATAVHFVSMPAAMPLVF